MTRCSRCGVNERRPSHAWCNPCFAAYMRTYRITHPPSGRQRVKAIARSAANVAQRRGKLVRQPCIICGARAEKHHPDHGRPLEVIWLCRPHHLAVERGEITVPMF